MDISRHIHIHNNYIAILVNPNSPKTKILRYDYEKRALRVNIHAKPEDNDSNVEIVKFFSKIF